ncbi:hypothetical protein [Flavobacterium sp.]|uniref:hypothetical protein n=1 Tax=Flavobacterium sp. TaxID=239 RepID=UPI00260ED241|nr:hypothetical protein [Flavobacterium sp.]
MKKLFTLLLIGIFCIGCSSDSSSDDAPSLATVSSAKQEYDSSNFGIYKGVFIGSSGTVFINIMNDGNINARLVIDGVTYNFTTTVQVALNQAIDGLVFTSDDMSFTVDVSADGSDISVVSSNIPGHLGATFNIVKEYSSDLVKCYEGTYTGTDQGTFNMVIIDTYIYGLTRPNVAESEAVFLTGSLNLQTNGIEGSYEGGSFGGTLSGNNVSGEWQNTNPQDGSGTWTGTRTL